MASPSVTAAETSGVDTVLALLSSLAGPEAAGRPTGFSADPLADPGEASRFLRASAATVPTGTPDPRQLRRLRELRDAASARAQGQRRRYEELARPLLRRYTFTLDPRGGLERPGRGWERFVQDALLALVELPDGVLRLCRNPACRWAFVDRSNSGRRIWCDMARCGNRAKVARFRRRARGRASGGARSRVAVR